MLRKLRLKFVALSMSLVTIVLAAVFAAAIFSARDNLRHISREVVWRAMNAPPGAEQMVGFTDATQNPPKNYLLSQGQTKDGWTVVSIDAASRRTVLSHGGISVPLYLGAVANLTTKKP